MEQYPISQWRRSYQIAKTIDYTNIIRPICLPKGGNFDRVGEVKILSGWGPSSDSNKQQFHTTKISNKNSKTIFLTLYGDFNISTVLRQTNTTVISNAKCSQFYDKIYDATLSVSTVEGYGTCNVIPVFDGIAFFKLCNVFFFFFLIF